MQCSASCAACSRRALHGAYGLHAASCGAAADFPDGRACDGDGHRARARPCRLAACDACARPLHYDAAALALAAELGGGEPTARLALGPRRIGAAESHHPHAQCSFMRRCALHANTSAQRGLAAEWSLRACAIGNRTKGPPPLLKWLTVWSAGASRVTAWGVLPLSVLAGRGCIRHGRTHTDCARRCSALRAAGCCPRGRCVYCMPTVQYAWTGAGRDR